MMVGVARDPWDCFLGDSATPTLLSSPDALDCVTSFLSVQEVVNFGMVSKRMHVISSTDSLWKRQFVRDFSTRVPTEAARSPSFSFPAQLSRGLRGLQRAISRPGSTAPTRGTSLSTAGATAPYLALTGAPKASAVSMLPSGFDAKKAYVQRYKQRIRGVQVRALRRKTRV
jgi:hypothetical protein